MSVPFVHLHNHTEYSLLDGAQKIEPMVQYAKALGMSALAITDHGVMYGVVDFYFECLKHNIKPIIGMEAYIAPDGLFSRQTRDDRSNYHLLLLAKNNEGYQNLCKLASIASLDGFYGKPRIDHETLSQHSKGLIATTTCLSGEVCSYLLDDDYEKAESTAAMYRDMFGEGNYFVELQDHGIESQLRIKEGLLRIAERLKLPLICTNDSHYLKKEDAHGHDVLLCIQTGKRVSDAERMRFDTQEFYLKSPLEMEALFSDTPSALENTAVIADMVDVKIVADRPELPDPDVPPHINVHSYLAQSCWHGLSERVGEVDQSYRDRLTYELEVIEKTGFSKYFLLVSEFAQFTRDRGIYFGVRGSAAGSLVSYCLRITDVDPIEYGLTFERFLNPERIAMPDIDLDFEDARREEVLRYVRERFGESHVAQIVTFGRMGARAAIRDSQRALGHSISDADRLCKIISPFPGVTLESELEENEELQKLYSEDEVSRELIDTAKSIEGISRQAGVHAAGVVISKEPLGEIVPLARGTEGQTITQYSMDSLEKLGLLKMDFLGLSNLTVLSQAVKKISEAGKGEVDVLKIPLDDAKTYEMLGRGETVGVFQLEGAGMTRYVTELKPRNIGELAAMVALYRPGPIDHISRYIRTRNGKEKPHYIDERMKPILEETYGVIVYQDQVLHIVRALAGFSLGEADILRKAMGKKDVHAMESSRQKFLEGALKNGLNEKVAGEVFDLLRPFAGYAFNKAHAVCYAMIAYQTAYLKANYPVEFMCALLGAYRDREERVIAFIDECRRNGVKVLQPDINRSEFDFTVENGNSVRFGLGAIKGIGSAAIEGILKARKEGPFVHLYDLVERTKLHGGLNRSALDALIRAGALDSIDPNRAKLLSHLDAAMTWADRRIRELRSGQESLFDQKDSVDSRKVFPVLDEEPEMSQRDRLAKEKEVMGLYLSDHPLREYEKVIEKKSTHTIASALDLDEGLSTKVGGVITSVRVTRVKKTQETMAILTIEDFTGQIAVTVFPKLYAELSKQLIKDSILIVQGRVRHWENKRGGSGRLIEIAASSFEILFTPQQFLNGNSEVSGPGLISVKVSRASRLQLQKAYSLIRSNPGEYVISFLVGDNGTVKEYQLSHKVSDGAWMAALRRTFDQCFLEVTRNGLSPF